MKVWHTFGALGSTIVELSWRDIFALILGREVYIQGTGSFLSLGKSKQKALGKAPSREKQLAGRT